MKLTETLWQQQAHCEDTGWSQVSKIPQSDLDIEGSSCSGLASWHTPTEYHWSQHLPVGSPFLGCWSPQLPSGSWLVSSLTLRDSRVVKDTQTTHEQTGVYSGSCLTSHENLNIYLTLLNPITLTYEVRGKHLPYVKWDSTVDILNALKRATVTVVWTQEINHNFLTLTVATQQHRLMVCGGDRASDSQHVNFNWMMIKK